MRHDADRRLALRPGAAPQFGGAFTDLVRFRDTEMGSNGPALSEAELDGIMHIALPILGGHVLEGADVLPTLGHQLNTGSNVSINLHPDSRDEAGRLHQALSVGSAYAPGMADMPWGAYGGTFEDWFGVRWMINYS